jgi:ATPase subunit of ABC transporter with duplicated ATPase domains
VSFRVAEGEHAALVGANGIGKSTLLRVVAGLEPATSGAIRADGRVGLMRQFIGSDATPTTVRDFLLAYAEPRIAEAAARVWPERWMRDHPGEERSAVPGGACTRTSGYEAEVLFDRCTPPSRRLPEAPGAGRDAPGGERKQLALQVIFRPIHVILLDDRQRADIEGKRRTP